MRWTVLAVALALAACDAKPDFLEMEPKSYTFKRPGEDVWWSVVGKTRQGKVIHKLTVVWSSSDPKVAEVDQKGRVKAVGPGRAAIAAEFKGLRAEAVVEVLMVDRVTIEPSELTLEARGDPAKITITVFDALGRPLKDRAANARCQNEDVCRTSNDGVHPVDPGETVLVVSAEGKKAEIPVKVLPGDPKKQRE